jgi:hypothetical protein
VNPLQLWGPLLLEVRVADICAYLESKGWVRKPWKRPEMLWFEGPLEDGQPIMQLVPASEELADFQMRVGDLLLALSTIEGRTGPEVLQDIVNARKGQRPDGGQPAEERQ